MTASCHIVYIGQRKEDFLVGSSHWPALDYAYLRRGTLRSFWCISPPLPAYLAHLVKEEAASLLRQIPLNALDHKQVQKLIRVLGREYSYSNLDVKQVPVSIDHRAEDVLNRVDQLGAPKALGGRLLLYREAKFLLERGGHCRHLAPLDYLHLTALMEKCWMFPAITFEQGTWVCHRCGSRTGIDLVPCARCGELCALCDNCRSLGLVRGCDWLYAFGCFRVPKPLFGQLFCLDYELSKPQQDAARKVVEFTQTPAKGGCLVWAVCGAGKTEVVYPAMESVLKTGGKVLFAIPRRDVVAELHQRIGLAFPKVSTTALYGGVKDRYQRGLITVATTHQVLRFYRAFDLVILDEMDAFPYRGSAMLKLGVERACKKFGKTIYMSATPTSDLIKQGKTGKIELAFIPARHHGYPVPEPRLAIYRWCRWGQSMRERTEFVKALDQEVLRGNWWRKLLIFVPFVAMTRPLALLLAQMGWKADFCYAGDPLRQQKIEQFRQGQLQILVATSLLERGITIPRLDVLILFAHESRIYDASTLIQMSGRVGRSPRWPTGAVLLAANRKTFEMQTSLRTIRQFNDRAQAKGYLSPGGERYLKQMRARSCGNRYPS
ncbi:MAG: helicase-related protein [Limnochordia bacterium]|nr:helicase-related protein [Limnochordia bacterium]